MIASFSLSLSPYHKQTGMSVFLLNWRGKEPLQETGMSVKHYITDYMCRSVIRSMNDLEVQSKDAVSNNNKADK
jgi:hypothetical protein